MTPTTPGFERRAQRATPFWRAVYEKVAIAAVIGTGGVFLTAASIVIADHRQVAATVQRVRVDSARIDSVRMTADALARLVADDSRAIRFKLDALGLASCETAANPVTRELLSCPRSISPSRLR